MQTRIDPLAFGLTLAVSVVLHGGFFYALPGIVPSIRPPTADTVFVDLPPLPAEPQSEPESAPAEAPPEAPAPEPEPPARDGLPDEVRPAAQPPAPASEPRTAAGAAQAPSPNPSPDVPKPPAAVSAERPLPVAPPTPKATPKTATGTERAVASLKDLLPSSRELARFRSSALPDPSGGTAREATIGLGEVDVRYRGYIDQVHGAIYSAWHVGRGLLVAGRSRRVVVRFSLNTMGMVQDAEVVEPSGNPTLDTEALEAVKRGRLPPFPTHWTLERLSLMAQFDYVFQ